MIEIGKKYAFEAYSPYDSFISPNKAYLVVTKRPIFDLKNAGVDVFKEVYEAYGRTEEEYLNDINNNVYILTLTEDTVNNGYVPENMVTILDKSYSGLLYNEFLVGIKIGLFKSDFDFTNFQNELEEFVRSSLGVDAKIQISKSSSETYLSEETYTELENTRKSVSDNSIFSKYERYEDRIELLEDKIKRVNFALIVDAEDNIIPDAFDGNLLVNLIPEMTPIEHIMQSSFTFKNCLSFVYFNRNVYYTVESDNTIKQFKVFDGQVIDIKSFVTDEIQDASNIYVFPVETDRLVVFYFIDSDLKYSLIDGNTLEEIKNDIVLSDIDLPRTYLPTYVTDNHFNIGFTDSDQVYRCKIAFDFETDDVLIETDVISSITINDSPLDENCLFSLTVSELTGLIEYNGYCNNVDVSEDGLLVGDNDFSDHYLGTGVITLRTFEKDRFVWIYNKDGFISIKTVDSQGETYGEILNSDVEFNTNILQTFDNSLITPKVTSDTSFMLKKII